MRERLGLGVIPGAGWSARDIQEVAREAEAAGFDAIFSTEVNNDALATAQQLFAVLRDFDAQGVKLIWIENPPATPEWDGVRDRLARAAAS